MEPGHRPRHQKLRWPDLFSRCNAAHWPPLRDAREGEAVPLHRCQMRWQQNTIDCQPIDLHCRETPETFQCPMIIIAVIAAKQAEPTPWQRRHPINRQPDRIVAVVIILQIRRSLLKCVGHHRVANAYDAGPAMHQQLAKSPVPGLH